MVADVFSVDKVRKEFFEPGVIDFFCAGVGFEAGLCGVGALVGVVNEHVIPGLVAVGLCEVALVPRFGGLAGEVYGNDDAPISVAFVFDDLTGFEVGLSCVAGSAEEFLYLGDLVLVGRLR